MQTLQYNLVFLTPLDTATFPSEWEIGKNTIWYLKIIENIELKYFIKNKKCM